MQRNFFILLLIFYYTVANAQKIAITGNVKDTASKEGLPNVLLMALRFNDSTLVNYSRTNNEGIFKPLKIPVDTYLVILSHPNYNDKTYLIVASKTDTVFNFKNCILPPKSIVLKEVEVFAYKEKSYYKGDTLIFTADSFKTRPNATVEDLLKKLPGVRVDAAGKITIQGKAVDQVLVDGDEFFGSDPTIATRNLNATTIENVQVYEKKSEDPDKKDETLKVVNLKLKEDAKKGYFGKISAASDFQKFYENEVLANKFKGNQKISVFGIFANTPNQAFDWNDADQYGLTNEQNNSYNEETGSWTSNNNEKKGVPNTLKSGFYFNDKLGKKTKVNSSYTFNQNQLVSGTETTTQYFLEDTNYINKQVVSNTQKNQNHSFDLKLNQKLDSLTDLTITPKIKYTILESSNLQQDQFIAANSELTRQTTILNKNNKETIDGSLFLKLNKNFLKKNRNLVVSYQPSYYTTSNSALLNTDFIYLNNQLPNSSLNQKRIQENLRTEHSAYISYIEPWTKKFKTEINYNFSNTKTNNNRNTYDFGNTAYDIFNPNLSNNFENKRQTNKLGAKLIYEVKKYRLSIATNYRNVSQQNINITSGEKLQLSVNNILPSASFNYRPGQNSNLSLSYKTSSQQPDLTQMQPVIDNTDPNRITIGNPNLKPTFSNNGAIDYYFYKGVSDINFYGGVDFGNTANQISYATTFDPESKTISQPININGNYFGSMYLGGGFPILNRFLKVYYSLNANHDNNMSLVNGQKNNSQSSGIDPGLSLEKSTDSYNISIGGNYSYNITKSNISSQSNQPYYSYGLEGNMYVKLPKKFAISTDGKYTNNGNRTSGYNLNYFILNASASKTFFKLENLIISIVANDILNQNIANQRYISSNQIVDTKTQIIKRYFLLKAVYKFNSQKIKSEEDEYYD